MMKAWKEGMEVYSRRRYKIESDKFKDEERGDGKEGDNDDGDIVEHGSFVGIKFFWL